VRALRLSSSAQRTLRRAEALARSQGHGQLATVHLVVALAEQPGATTAALSEQRGDEVLDALAPAAWNAYNGPPAAADGDLELDRGEAREALADAADEAEVQGDFEIQPAHLFLAATADPRWSAPTALRALGVDVERARRFVDEHGRDERLGTV